MTTSTKTDVLTELAARERKLERARAEASAAGAKLTETKQKVEALQGELRRLYQDDPESFDHKGQPLRAASPAGKTAAQLGKLDLGDVQARYQHARQIEQRADQALRDFCAAHYAELIEAIEPEAKAAAAEIQRCGDELHEAAQKYLGTAKRIEGWRGAAARRDRSLQRVRSVGIEKGGELVRQTAQFAEPVPSPTETR